MPKHENFIRKPAVSPEKNKTHPIWRGIGCLLMVLIPLLSYIASSLLIDNIKDFPWIIIPQDIVVTKFAEPLIFVKIVYAAIITFILALLFAIVTFVIDRFFGPPRYGPFDSKP